MRILLVVNPISGRGRAAARAEAVADHLAGAGHDASIRTSEPGPAEPWLAPALEGRELLVVVGGDGMVRTAGAVASAAGIPVYHHPCGTENLFARQWRMDRAVETLCRAIECRQVIDVDLGRVNGQPFLLMASIGLDAEVVRDLSDRRSGGITHLTYAWPILRQLLRWRPARLEITVDGERVVDGSPGGVVVANCRQYGARLDPAPDADMTDGRLDVVHLPARGPAGMLAWIVRCRTGRQRRAPGLVESRGRDVLVRTDRPVRFQIDGDCPDGPEHVTELKLGLEPGALRVLVP